MLIPYRVKNPPKKFPYATVSLIAINFVVFGFTAPGMMIKESVVRHFAYTFPVSPLFNIISSAFLHGDIFHIVGNMLFLWVFGPPVEDRLGIPRYLALYLITGLMGVVCQGGLDVMLSGTGHPCIGASACIMGVVGAYWYLFPYSTVCVFYMFGWFIRGVKEVRAVWIIGLFVGMDVVNGALSGAMGVTGGVANFAHVGGALAGLLLCMAVGVKRDTAEMSEARAIHADMGSLAEMPFHSLILMHEHDPHNLEILRAIAKSPGKVGEQMAIDESFERYGPQLVVDDPMLMAQYLTVLQGKPDIYHAGHIVQIGSVVERSGDVEQAMNIYRMVADGRPNDPAAETALYRLAVCSWNFKKDARETQKYLQELKDRFPYSEMMIYARQLWNEMPQQTSSNSDRRAA